MENKIVAEYIIKRKANISILLLTGVWSIAWLFVMVIIVMGIITQFEYNVTPLVLFAIFFGIIGLIVVKAFLWQLKGKEKITLTKDKLIISKLGTILTSPCEYETREIGRFKLTEKVESFSLWRIYGFTGGKISFDYYENEKHFGQTLSRKEASVLIEELNEKIKITTR
jgi:hypothetical protein